MAKTNHQFFTSWNSSKLSKRKIKASQKAVNINTVSIATDKIRFWLLGNFTR